MATPVELLADIKQVLGNMKLAETLDTKMRAKDQQSAEKPIAGLTLRSQTPIAPGAGDMTHHSDITPAKPPEENPYKFQDDPQYHAKQEAPPLRLGSIVNALVHGFAGHPERHIPDRLEEQKEEDEEEGESTETLGKEIVELLKEIKAALGALKQPAVPAPDSGRYARWRESVGAPDGKPSLFPRPKK